MAEQTIKLSDVVHFLPRQLEATEAADTHHYTLYGGSAGPGKSYWLRWYPIRKMIKWGAELGLTGIHGALFSKDYGTLKDRQISKMEVEMPKWLGEVRNSKTDGLAFHLHPKYGSHVLCLRNLDDPSKYLSSEFAIQAVEELTENDFEIFNILRTRNRWTGIEDVKFIAATNPGGQGHAAVKKLWIDRDFPPELKSEANEFIYVKALPSDNPYLSESYMRILDSLPEKLRKAYRDGNWDVFEGQYFAEWDATKHVCEPFIVPDAWPRFRSIDPSGRSGVTSCHWYAVDRDGRVWVYREHYGTGMDIDQHAQAIAKLSRDKDGIQEKYQYTVMDTAAWAKAGYSETAVEIFMRNGVGTEEPLIQSDKHRIVGWNSCHTYMRWDVHTQPKLKIFKTCYNMIRTIPLLQHDELHPEDVDTKGDDHCADDLRYMLQSLREGRAPKVENVVERKMRQMQEQESSYDFNYTR
jgi:phage terminase large subunit